MREIFDTVYRVYAKLLMVLAVIAAFGFFAIMWLIDLNSLSRKVFNAPITGTLEITEATMVIAILMPMAYTQMRGGHIRVTLLTKHLSPRWQRHLYTFTLAVGFVFCAWATYASFNFFLRSYAVDEHAWGTVSFPIYPSKGAVALGLLLLTIQFLLQVIRVGVFGIEDEEFADHGEEADMTHGDLTDG